MGLVIEQRPVNPDTRTRWQKFWGKPYVPFLRYDDTYVWEVLNGAVVANRANESERRCKIGRVRLTTEGLKLPA